ncbi:MAG: amino acid ABC transporter permease [Bifidobacteriaceae bacterium]|jgi:polar amino acid transport system permease protein|nr:amino acid ABC transporter permease [Bifidobacteriaceae bacterium]
MARKSKENQVEIPNRINALPVRHTATVVAGVVVALLALMLVQGIVTNERFEWDVVWRYLFNEHVLDGIGWTLILTVASMLIAVVLSVLLAVMRSSGNVVLRGVSWFWIWFFRGTPVYTQLVFWGLFSVLVPKLSLGIPFTSIEFWSVDSRTVLTATVAAILGLALNESAYLAEIVRAGIEAVDTGQGEAAKALGMRGSLIMRRIVLPQAMRIIVPPVGNETIGMLKTTSLVMAVPFSLELQYATDAIANRIYKPIPLLLVACIWYLVITTVLMVLQSRLEKHFGKGFEQRPLGSADGPVSPSNRKLDSKEKDNVKKYNETMMTGLNA